MDYLDFVDKIWFKIDPLVNKLWLPIRPFISRGWKRIEPTIIELGEPLALRVGTWIQPGEQLLSQQQKLSQNYLDEELGESRSWAVSRWLLAILGLWFLISPNFYWVRIGAEDKNIWAGLTEQVGLWGLGLLMIGWLTIILVFWKPPGLHFILMFLALFAMGLSLYNLWELIWTGGDIQPNFNSFFMVFISFLYGILATFAYSQSGKIRKGSA